MLQRVFPPHAHTRPHIHPRLVAHMSRAAAGQINMCYRVLAWNPLRETNKQHALFSHTNGERNDNDGGWTRLTIIG